MGRTYDSDVIRINSQSGKGGVSYILKQNFSISLPRQMQEEVGYAVKQVSDKSHSELSLGQVFDIFKKQYVDYIPAFAITECHFKQGENFTAEVTLLAGEQHRTVKADGNGRLDAVSNAIKQHFGIDYKVAVYEEHAMSQGSSSKAAAYVGIRANEKMYWGVGIDDDIIRASVHALTVAVNKLYMSVH